MAVASITTRQLFRLWRKSMWESGYRYSSEIDEIASLVNFANGLPPTSLYLSAWLSVYEPEEITARVNAWREAEQLLETMIRREVSGETDRESERLHLFRKIVE